MRDLRQTVQIWFDCSLDLIFPPRCVHCKRGGAVWCLDCQRAVTPALSVETEADESPLAGRQAYAVFAGSIRSAIHGLKYEHKTRLAEPLGVHLAETLRITGWQPTLCTAVPLHVERMSERGYNQSILLARHVARLRKIETDFDAIIRSRATRPQVGLNYIDRQNNMVDAFHANESARDQSVLIIDDVYTTGATIRACAAALRSAGAATVWALTVARAASVSSDHYEPPH